MHVVTVVLLIVIIYCVILRFETTVLRVTLHKVWHPQLYTHPWYNNLGTMKISPETRHSISLGKEYAAGKSIINAI